MSGERVDIETLLHWAYARQAVDAVDVSQGAIWAMLAGGRGNGARMADVGAAGGVIDGSSSLLIGTRMADDAFEVAQAVEAVCCRQAHLVAAHARANTRPDWRPGARFRAAPELSEGRALAACDATAVRGEAGESVTWIETPIPHIEVRTRDRHRNLIRRFCPIQLEDTPDHVVALRLIYELWWGFVALVADRLKAPGVLKKFEVAGFAAPSRPWGAADDRRWRRWIDLGRTLDRYAET